MVEHLLKRVSNIEYFVVYHDKVPDTFDHCPSHPQLAEFRTLGEILISISIKVILYLQTIKLKSCCIELIFAFKHHITM